MKNTKAKIFRICAHLCLKAREMLLMNELVEVAQDPSGRFDYSLYDPPSVELLESLANTLRRRGQDMLHLVVETGRDLLVAKRHVRHGEFEKWVALECGFTIRTAELWMNVAMLNPEQHGLSHLRPSALYLLAAPSSSEEVRDTAIERIKNEKRGATVKDMRSLLAEIKAEQAESAFTINDAVELEIEPLAKVLREALQAKLLVMLSDLLRSSKHKKARADLAKMLAN